VKYKYCKPDICTVRPARLTGRGGIYRGERARERYPFTTNVGKGMTNVGKGMTNVGKGMTLKYSVHEKPNIL
jgi:hypothetical protein